MIRITPQRADRRLGRCGQHVTRLRARARAIERDADDEEAAGDALDADQGAGAPRERLELRQLLH